ncbi:MAG: NUDIX hydrolase [Deltaproteobacteria bacterium]|nr:NUDIX hydrolase [Deltaproteobacteria bacterium]
MLTATKDRRDLDEVTMRKLERNTLSRKKQFETRVFSIWEERVKLPSSDREKDYYVIESQDWINIIALTDEGNILLIRQFRQGTRSVTVEIPGGMVDPGEDPLDAAKRELREETGYAAVTWEEIGSVTPNPAIQSNRTYTFLARGAHKAGNPEPDEDEEIETEEVALTRIPRLLEDGTIEHALVVAAFAHLARKGLLDLSRHDS